MIRKSCRNSAAIGLACLVLLTGGCVTPRPVPIAALPSELGKVVQQPYTIDTPDLIQIDLLAAIPKPPYKVRALDVLGFYVSNPLPEAPINASLTVDPDGTVDLGPQYGSVNVAGKTLPEVRAATEELLNKVLRKSRVNVSLVQTRAAQQIRGPHLVRGDGTVGLGVYGAVQVVGLTTPQAKQAIDAHLGQYFLEPDVSVEVVGYNSKVYFVVFDFGGAGQQVTRLPLTGNETVLDAISQTSGLPTVADGTNMWVARAQRAGCPPLVMPVDWCAVVEQGDTRTNYQLLPGDRVFVRAHPLVKADVRLARLLSPIERLLGVALLGSSTVNSIRTDPNRNNNGSFAP